MICLGPYNETRLELSASSFADLDVRIELSQDCRKAAAVLRVELAHRHEDAVIDCSISLPRSKEESSLETTLKLSKAVSSPSILFDLVEPKLW